MRCRFCFPFLELLFDIDSQFADAHYRILLLDHQMIEMYSSDFEKLDASVTNVKFKFSATEAMLFQNKPGRVKLIISYEPKDDNIGKTLKLNNLRLSDPCHDEMLCNKKGECMTLASNSYKCKCWFDYSGTNCEFRNMCKEEVEPGISGSEYCLANNGINCEYFQILSLLFC